MKDFDTNPLLFQTIIQYKWNNQISRRYLIISGTEKVNIIATNDNPGVILSK